MLKQDQPNLVVVCPPCTVFSNLQWLTGDPWVSDPEAMKAAIELVNFGVRVCKEQLRNGRLFVFEHPLSASSWNLESMKALRKSEGVYQAIGHMCAFGMTSKFSVHSEEEGLVKKTIRVISNSAGTDQQLDR